MLKELGKITTLTSGYGLPDAPIILVSVRAQ